MALVAATWNWSQAKLKHQVKSIHMTISNESSAKTDKSKISKISKIYLLGKLETWWLEWKWQKINRDASKVEKWNIKFQSFIWTLFLIWKKLLIAVTACTSLASQKTTISFKSAKRHYSSQDINERMLSLYHLNSWLRARKSLYGNIFLGNSSNSVAAQSI